MSHWPFDPINLSLRQRQLLAHLAITGPCRLDQSDARVAAGLRNHGYVTLTTIDFKSFWSVIPSDQRFT